MATETTKQDSAAPKPAPVKPSAKRSKSKKQVAKKPVAKKSTAEKRASKKRASKKRASKKPVAAKKSAKKIAAKKRAVKKPVTAKTAAPPKRKVKQQSASQKISKAQAIRDSANELGKKARPRDIIAALAEKGISVSSPQVSMTLKAAGLRRGRRRKKAAVAAQMASRNGKSQTFNVNDLIQVRELAVRIGGIDKLKESVAALEKLQSIWIGV